MQIQLLVLAMQEWGEKQWKEITSPSIQNLFAQAIKDMKEGKPLPEVPPEMPASNEKSRWQRFARFHTPISVVIWFIWIMGTVHPLPAWYFYVLIGLHINLLTIFLPLVIDRKQKNTTSHESINI